MLNNNLMDEFDALVRMDKRTQRFVSAITRFLHHRHSEIRQAMLDAHRYQWIRQQEYGHIGTGTSVQAETPEQLDAAIDAAAEKGAKGR